MQAVISAAMTGGEAIKELNKLLDRVNDVG